MKSFVMIGALLLAGVVLLPSAAARQEGGERENEAAAATFAKQLNDPEPQTRQRAAEELAALAATSTRKLVEGYRLQEKNARVKLALDWALYRMGKNEALFNVVRELDSPRSAQAVTYLLRIEGPQPLYMFLGPAEGKTKIKLLEVLGRIGTEETAQRVATFTASPDREVARAAQIALEMISSRPAAPAEGETRPRQTRISDRP